MIINHIYQVILFSSSPLICKWPHTEKAGEAQGRGSHSRWVDGMFKKERTFHTRFVLVAARQGDLHTYPPNRRSLYRGLNWVQSCISGVPKLWDLIPDDLSWIWSNNMRNKMHSKRNALESPRNHPLPPVEGGNCLAWNQSLVPKSWGPLVYTIQMVSTTPTIPRLCP